MWNDVFFVASGMVEMKGMKVQIELQGCSLEIARFATEERDASIKIHGQLQKMYEDSRAVYFRDPSGYGTIWLKHDGRVGSWDIPARRCE